MFRLTLWFPTLLLAFIFSTLRQPTTHNVDLLARDASGQPANALLLTAHPDDECMFFAPTVLALLERAANVYSLCLSIGNAEGLGEVRRGELARSLDVLGVPEGRRWAIDRPDLQDNFTARWEPQIIADVLRPFVLEHQISTILTFDDHGVSSHPNHASLPAGAAHLLGDAGLPGPMRLFTLVSVPLHEKYLGALSPLVSKAALAVTPRMNAARPVHQAVAIAGWEGYKRALGAMREHASQLVWFRYLYVAFSRYMWVNEWVEVVAAV